MAGQAKLRVVIDTNLVVSGVIVDEGLPAKLLQGWREGLFVLVISEILLNEMKVVLSRPRLQKYNIGSGKIEGMVDTLKFGAEIVKPMRSENLPVHCRDAKDDLLLATSLAGEADYLVTGDEDLLVLNKNPGLKELKIVTVREFLRLTEWQIT